MMDDIKPLTIDPVPQAWIDGNLGSCDDCDAKVMNLTELEAAIAEGSFESLEFKNKIPLPGDVLPPQFIDEFL